MSYASTYVDTRNASCDVRWTKVVRNAFKYVSFPLITVKTAQRYLPMEKYVWKYLDKCMEWWTLATCVTLPPNMWTQQQNMYHNVNIPQHVKQKANTWIFFTLSNNSYHAPKFIYACAMLLKRMHLKMESRLVFSGVSSYDLLNY